MMSKSITYSDAGVSIDAANRAVAWIKEMARTTFNARTLSEIGSFGGMFDGAFPNLQAPVLVASADGVGTKLKIASETNTHDTVGRDLVNHCVNDILVQGARPLFFLDYIAAGVLAPETIASVVAGMARGCRENGCVLLGGETAEMPGFYAIGEYDIAGFIVGVVDRARVIDGSRIIVGDAVLALPSVGLHTNGYSLARKLLFEVEGTRLTDQLADELLRVHRSYLKPIRELFDAGLLRGAAHITGGGITDNVPRVLPKGLAAEVHKSSWRVPDIFERLRAIGNIPEDDWRRTFNLGIGMVLVIGKQKQRKAEKVLRKLGEQFYVIGSIVKSARRRVVYV